VPELPEVETIRCSLLGNVGTAIKEVQIKRADIIKVQDYQPEILIGQHICDIRRRGKYLILDLEPGYALVVHLGMSGRFYMQAEDMETNAPHIHMIIQLDNQCKLIYMDARRFGGIRFLNDPESIFHQMGPEPLSLEFTDEYLHEILQNRRTAIKTLLLNQSLIAGIGNIYADEALFAARILPARPAGSLRPAEVKRLRQAIVDVLQASITQRGTTFRDFRDGYNKTGDFQQLLQVYGKTGCSCNICGKALKKEKIGGRSSHYCEHCQK
jgi:formamidopyrimidine-DNA glycosylase